MATKWYFTKDYMIELEKKIYKIIRNEVQLFRDVKRQGIDKLAKSRHIIAYSEAYRKLWKIMDKIIRYKPESG